MEYKLKKLTRKLILNLKNEIMNLDSSRHNSVELNQRIEDLYRRKKKLKLLKYFFYLKIDF